jgi:hypothetical protein
MKAELTEKLPQRGILTSATCKNVKEICLQNNIKTHEEIQKVIPGWGGKQKGLLQSLWEHDKMQIAVSRPNKFRDTLTRAALQVPDTCSINDQIACHATGTSN